MRRLPQAIRADGTSSAPAAPRVQDAESDASYDQQQTVTTATVTTSRVKPCADAAAQLDSDSSPPSERRLVQAVPASTAQPQGQPGQPLLHARAAAPAVSALRALPKRRATAPLCLRFSVFSTLQCVRDTKTSVTDPEVQGVAGGRDALLHTGHGAVPGSLAHPLDEKSYVLCNTIS